VRLADSQIARSQDDMNQVQWEHLGPDIIGVEISKCNRLKSMRR
jgi:hypothetical protein